MKPKFNLKTLAVALLIATAPLPMAAYAAPANQSVVQKTFAAPEDAGKALADAVSAKDVGALLAVVGPKSRSWLFSGDEVADREAWDKFLLAYERKNSISQSADGRAMLLVGDGDWSFPAPLVKKEGAWVFDSAAGREEIINRRVGENELSAIQTLLATVDAQREYAAADLDGNGFNDYARRFISSAGAKDGLYWPATANRLSGRSRLLEVKSPRLTGAASGNNPASQRTMPASKVSTAQRKATLTFGLSVLSDRRR